MYYRKRLAAVTCQALGEPAVGRFGLSQRAEPGSPVTILGSRCYSHLRTGWCPPPPQVGP